MALPPPSEEPPSVTTFGPVELGPAVVVPQVGRDVAVELDDAVPEGRVDCVDVLELVLVESGFVEDEVELVGVLVLEDGITAQLPAGSCATASTTPFSALTILTVTAEFGT